MIVLPSAKRGIGATEIIGFHLEKKINRENNIDVFSAFSSSSTQHNVTSNWNWLRNAETHSDMLRFKLGFSLAVVPG